MLDVIRTTHSRNPWRLAWKGQPLEDVGFARLRDARQGQKPLLARADWTVHPDTWDTETRCAVVAVLEAVPSVQELTRLRWRKSP